MKSELHGQTYNEASKIPNNQRGAQLGAPQQYREWQTNVAFAHICEQLKNMNRNRCLPDAPLHNDELLRHLFSGQNVLLATSNHSPRSALLIICIARNVDVPYAYRPK